MYIKIAPLSRGWISRVDPTEIPLGGAFEMRNCRITDRGGIAPREGTKLFGASSGSGDAIKSTWTHKLRSGTNIPHRSYGAVLEYWNTETTAYETLKTGLTDDQVFDSEINNVNSSAQDYEYFCNAVDPYMRWNGYHSKLTAALAGGETSIPVTTTLKSSVYYSGTASASTNTTITIATAHWATNMWNNFYVRITSGAHSGKIALISGTTSTQITFAAIAGLTGAVTFEIRQLACSASGTLIYGGTEIAYTAVPTDSSFTVGAAHAAAISSAVAEVPENVLGGAGNLVPRGNIFLTQYTRMFISGRMGYEASTYYSKILDAADYSYSAPRAADDGGVIDSPEGGGPVKDLVLQEDKIYILKNGIVKTLTFTQDGNDLPAITTLLESPSVSVAGRAFKVNNDTYFATNQNAITSIGRLPNIDSNPRSFDISYDVKGGISLMDFSESRGISYQDKAIIACKETDSSSANDIMIVRNFKVNDGIGAWEGIWDLEASDFFEYNGKPYYGSSADKECYEMFYGLDKERDDLHYPVNAYWKSGYMNFTEDGQSMQEVDQIAVRGWIKRNTKLTFDIAYDFGSSAETFSWDFEGIEEDYTFGEPVYNVLGTFPLGVMSIGSSVESIDEEKVRFIVYFNVPRRQHMYLQVGFGSNDTQQDWEITALAVRAEAVESINTSLVKDTEE